MTQSEVLGTLADVWAAMVHHLSPADIRDAADDFVMVLIDVHEFEAEDIQDAFGEHPAIRKAVKHYLSDEAPEPVDYERDYDLDDDDGF